MPLKGAFPCAGARLLELGGGIEGISYWKAVTRRAKGPGGEGFSREARARAPGLGPMSGTGGIR